MKKLGLLVVAIVLTTITGVFAQAKKGSFLQIQEPVKWQVGVQKISETEGVINIVANIEKGWNIYGLKVPEGGPTSTTFKFQFTDGATLNKGVLSNPKVSVKHDDIFGMEVPYYTGKVTFQQKVKLQKGQTTVTGQVLYMACDDEQCINPDPYDFKVVIK
ncbi:protein-disulfide reductase DsbD family protein [Sphingobacterium sp. UT-1RO-CII-1]|uniref:protein-disulfide reductase DsbD domain-containing protein n=1 Tax=Sphingobacterium sp. UT-1RO-CII-1 TaxID=2995225 RepID=UPI00227B9646|nr:protein-disulfide reductase DsbD domain-containing protein [Sphingobacterium sp. UT-1RO-CII-1]MCY4780862.1 protein-disulfide reductase DsbD family protein [Sphingobacterium sp. UT-1RO-CII-1]